MTVKISQNSFVSLLSKSGLIPAAALESLVDEFHQSESGGPDEGERLAQFLVRKGQLTTWQARKLLQGKHKGFTLGKYRLLSLLGRGGMSSVYLAEHKVMRRRCAIKVLPGKQVNDEAALNRFHQEAQAVAALDDPNIVRAYDVDQVQEGNSTIHFLVMEYVEGRSLQEVVDQDGPLSIPDAIDYICQAANGLDHAHNAGMVHRDIKPSNLLLDRSGTVKVLDMGLARFFEQSDQQSLTLEHDQRVLGTADYLSPEQAVDSHGVDTRSDIYSLGGTLYYLLTGHPPFPEGSLAQRLLAHQTKQPRPVNQERPDVPASLVRILEQMMAKTPDERPPTAGAVREQLQDWLKQQGDAFAAATRPPRTRGGNQPADPTSDGWSDLPRESFTRPGPPAEPTSNVGDDPGLGDFLTSLSSQIDPGREDSDRFTGAKTVVSSRRPTPPVEPAEIPLDPSDVHVTADSSVRPYGGSSSSSGSRARRTARTLPTWLVGGGAGLCALLIGAYFLLPANDPPATPVAENAVPSAAAVAPAERAPAATSRPQIEPGSDITVGPEGHFATIGEAIAYVAETFQPLSATDEQTIRVAGGGTYAESITIDNSQFGAFPQGVKILCEDAAPAVLAPSGIDPVVHLINVERFRLQGFELAGSGRPTVMRVEGYLVSTQFEQLAIRDAGATAIEAVGISGFGGRRVEFRDLLIHQSAANAVGIDLSAGARPTKELLVHRCRFDGQLKTGIRIDGEASRIEISECRFDNVANPVQFAGNGQPLENISLVNNTFRDFDRGIHFAGLPQIGNRGVSFQKNLFTGVRGPEVVVEGGDFDPATLWKGSGPRFNWSEGTADLAGGQLDIFANDGRRGIDTVSFASSDAANGAAFLKPQDTQLRTAAQGAPAPKHIGALAPGN